MIGMLASCTCLVPINEACGAAVAERCMKFGVENVGMDNGH